LSKTGEKHRLVKFRGFKGKEVVSLGGKALIII